MMSSAIVVFAWLRIPEGLITERLLGSRDAFELSQWRLWLAVLAVLVYLTLRYQFNNETTAQWARFQSEKAEGRNQLRQSFVRKQIEHCAATGTDKTIFGNTLTATLRHAAAYYIENGDKIWGPGRWRIEQLTVIPKGPRNREGEVRFLFLPQDDGDGGTFPERTLGYVFTRRREAWCWLASAIRTTLHSQGTADVIWPAGVTLVAAAIVGCRLGSEIARLIL
ncbi:hypothetical protein SAMN05444680_103473 [Variovorax sp. YR216]|nr:hypothetical protein SAMN05444680_103473 [Variovorax sp. YR216]